MPGVTLMPMLQHGFRGKSVPSVHGKFALLTPILHHSTPYFDAYVRQSAQTLILIGDKVILGSCASSKTLVLQLPRRIQSDDEGVVPDCWRARRLFATR
jgi:hypothetical protein